MVTKGFSIDITTHLTLTNNELFVAVFDPSDSGAQPEGKQRIAAITNPGGDTYTPSSGIWQTVWMELTPKTFVDSVKILADLTSVTVTVNAAGGASAVSIKVMKGTEVVATNSGSANVAICNRGCAAVVP